MSLRKGGQVIAGTPNITTGHHVGEIFWTSRLDNKLNGAVDADGAIYSVEAFTGEQSVPELLRKGSLPYVSLAEYESIVSANGSCRAWGWDNGDTFRVPLLKDVYLMAGQAESAGEFISESLPNITGGTGVGYGIASGGVSLTGAYDLGGVYTESYLTVNGGVATRSYVGFNASRSSSTYQDGAKVRPDSVRYRAMVQLSTGVKEDATQLKEYKFNNPHFFGQSMWTDVDPNNASWLVSNGAYHSGRTYGDYYKWLTDIKSGNKTVDGVSVKSVDDEYTDYDFVINTADTTFRLPLKTKLASGSAVVGNGMTLGLNNSANAQNTSWQLSAASSGALYRAVTDNHTGLGVTTNPDYSGIETSSNGLKLYFYVGDVLQDPALINAGGVLSDVADSIKRSSIVDRETVVGWGMPDYSAKVVVGRTGNSFAFVSPSKGFISLNGMGAGCRVNINNIDIGGLSYSTGFSLFPNLIPLDVGDNVNVSSLTTDGGLYFFPCKGVK